MIPVSTTTVSILRLTQPADSIDRSDDDYVVVETGIRAHLSSPSGSNTTSAVETTASHSTRLIADLCDLRDGDRVEDETTGYIYLASGVNNRAYNPIPHTVAQLSREVRVR